MQPARATYWNDIKTNGQISRMDWNQKLILVASSCSISMHSLSLHFAEWMQSERTELRSGGKGTHDIIMGRGTCDIITRRDTCEIIMGRGTSEIIRGRDTQCQDNRWSRELLSARSGPKDGLPLSASYLRFWNGLFCRGDRSCRGSTMGVHFCSIPKNQNVFSCDWLSAST